MSRCSRKQSKTGIYHVLLRGINKQQIFAEENDYIKFKNIIKECKEKISFEIYAYCLMNNHIHILIKEIDEKIGQIIGMIASKFATWYNTKYQRVGYLFQDRFKSEPVETNDYFIIVLRYIHQNPIKAGICEKITEYPYSSYVEFTDENVIINKDFVYGCISKDNFIEFHQMKANDNCLDIDDKVKPKITDEHAQKLIKKYTGCSNLTAFQCLTEAEKKNKVRKLYSVGLSIRQISRLTGVTKGMVEKWLK